MTAPGALDDATWSLSGPLAGRGRPLPVAVAAVSAVVLVAAPLWWMASRGSVEVGTPPWARADHPRPAPLPVTVELPSIGVRSGRPADLRPLNAARAPLRISIPSLGVHARIAPMGVEPTGAMEVPEDVATVGWYRFGPSPGLPGSAVLIGHVDSRVQGPGVFFGLSTLDLGDLIRVRVAQGRWESFRVVARSLVEKDRLPNGVFIRSGDPVLTLITCGGGFDAAAGRYTHNVVVSAVAR